MVWWRILLVIMSVVIIIVTMVTSIQGQCIEGMVYFIVFFQYFLPGVLLCFIVEQNDKIITAP